MFFCFLSQDHLRNVFYRMGFGDEGIVALSGAHTLGRAFKVSQQCHVPPRTVVDLVGVYLFNKNTHFAPFCAVYIRLRLEIHYMNNTRIGMV